MWPRQRSLGLVDWMEEAVNSRETFVYRRDPTQAQTTTGEPTLPQCRKPNRCQP